MQARETCHGRFPPCLRVEVLQSASSALSAFQDIVDPSYTPIGGSNYTLCVHHQAGTRVRGRELRFLATSDADCCLRPASRAASRFAKLTKISITIPLEHYAEQDNTCRQVRMSRQVFAEPPGAPGSAGSCATPQRCRSQMAGANTMVEPTTTKRPASRSCLPGLLRMGNPAFIWPREASGLD